MAFVRFAWSPTLVSLRKEVCPYAQWKSKGRQWMMSEDDAQRFIQAAQVRLDLQRGQAQITVDAETWMVGFVRDAPYRVTPASVS